jgi:hypothetical protein
MIGGVARWLTAAFVVGLIIFSATLLLTRNAQFLPAVPLFAVALGSYSGTNRLIRRGLVRRYGSIEEAMADERLTLPVTHLLPDHSPPPEGHDEPCPHDLPLGHPGRRARKA